MRLLLLDAWIGLRAQPARFLLAMGTMATGVATLTVLFAILAGLDQRAARVIAGFGADTIAIAPAAPPGTRGATLPSSVRTILRNGLDGITVSGIRLHRAVPLGAQRTVDVIAGDHALPHVRAWPLVAGRAFDPLDIRRALRVCLLTRALADELQAGLHQVIWLAGVPLRVVGIVAPSGAAAETDPRLAPGARFVVVPETVSPLWSQDPQAPLPGDDAIFLKTGSPASVSTVEARARSLLAGDARVPDCTWTTPDTLLAGIRKLRSVIGLAIGAVAMLCLLLGGATLAGLMLARIRERVPEIGLRRSLGASRADIAGLFVVEALMVSAGAALTGLAVPLGVLVAWDPARLPVAVALNGAVVLIPVCAVAGTAVLASLWPALAAARIAPHEALRND